MRVVVAGYVVRGPVGGAVWSPLQYVLGLQRLGHDVYFIEDSDDYPACYDPEKHVTARDPSYGLRFAARSFAWLGLGDRWAYHDHHTGSWRGPVADDARRLCETADVLITVGSANTLRPWHLGIPTRAFIDVDPVFTQIRHLTDPTTAALIEAHTSHFTFGVLIATGAAVAPDDGVQWQATRQPIVLDVWPQSRGEPDGRFTTAMVWDSYDIQDFAGLSYGMKSTSFTPYMDLPLHVRCELELAAGGHSVPRDELTAGGWRLVDPLPVTSELAAYQQYIRGSKAEFSVAKHGYVAGVSGWFSERSAAYLATGRPVVVQDTGFSEWLKTGEGVIAFRSPAESMEGIHDVNRNYSRHCRAAREIAESVFDSATVLPELLERIT